MVQCVGSTYTGKDFSIMEQRLSELLNEPFQEEESKQVFKNEA